MQIELTSTRENKTINVSFEDLECTAAEWAAKSESDKKLALQAYADECVDHPSWIVTKLF